MDSCIVGYSLKGLLRKRWADERVGVMITVAYYCGLLLWLTAVAYCCGLLLWQNKMG